ncbi:hypothetical protein CCICO_05645 [Corynebacterium ciconiae DSM 44920]|uniref:hypothetical protein n=1 Tax=Corynebacterium ciconiae TaxID=227319 RepID=UPI000366EAC8|nr:hypothetical protein [Corynebacterium ciconiae]WKD61157.1 hypothetical protein CCICO_05645 [Corynebacterium ciconiae DSM 44920]
MVNKLIPAMWVRLVILIIFGIFMYKEGLPWLAGFTVVLIALTIWQLITAYKQR